MTAASLVVGVLVLTGNGSVFLKTGRGPQRTPVYEPKRFERATGIMLLIFGLLTGIDCFTAGSPWKIAYVVSLVLTFAIYVVVLRRWCRLTEEEKKAQKPVSKHIVNNTKSFKK